MNGLWHQPAPCYSGYALWKALLWAQAGVCWNTESWPHQDESIFPQDPQMIQFHISLRREALILAFSVFRTQVSQIHKAFSHRTGQLFLLPTCQSFLDFHDVADLPKVTLHFNSFKNLYKYHWQRIGSQLFFSVEPLCMELLPDTLTRYWCYTLHQSGSQTDLSTPELLLGWLAFLPRLDICPWSNNLLQLGSLNLSSFLFFQFFFYR